MTERIKTLLKELYPSADPSKGVDFDKSGTVEAGETVKDFDGNGVIDDVDHGILTFNNRDAFVFHNGLKRWREVEGYWGDAAKNAEPLASKNEPALLANANTADEALQERIVNDEHGGRADLSEAEAGAVVKTQETIKEVHKKYPSMGLEGVRPSDAERTLEAMKELEEFNPKLAGAVEKITYNVDDCEDNPVLANVFDGGCGGGGEVNINPILKTIPPAGKEVVVHEATHVYHEKVGSNELHDLRLAEHKLTQYLEKKYLIDEGAGKNRPKLFTEKTAGIRGRARDTIERNIRQREAGEPYNEELLRLYDRWVSEREGSFDYQWNHVNQRYTPDAKYEEVEAAGKEMEKVQRDFGALTVEAFGSEGRSPCWHDPFFEGGDRQRAIVSGRVEELIDRCPDAGMKKRLEDKLNKLDNAEWKYRKALSDRNRNLTVSTSDASLVWKGIPLGGPNEGLAQPYGATNRGEAVATFVQYVHANGELPYKPGDARHNEMVKNYARVLRDHGFIRGDHPAVSGL